MISRSKSKSPRMTLQQYIESHNIRKKIEEINRSKSKGKDTNLQKMHENKLSGAYGQIQFGLNEIKMYARSILSDDKEFSQIAKMLGDVFIIIKGSMKKLYKDMLMSYLIELDNSSRDDKAEVSMKLNESFNGNKDLYVGNNMSIQERFKAQAKNNTFLNSVLNLSKSSLSNPTKYQHSADQLIQNIHQFNSTNQTSLNNPLQTKLQLLKINSKKPDHQAANNLTPPKKQQNLRQNSFLESFLGGMIGQQPELKKNETSLFDISQKESQMEKNVPKLLVNHKKLLSEIEEVKEVSSSQFNLKKIEGTSPYEAGNKSKEHQIKKKEKQSKKKN